MGEIPQQVRVSPLENPMYHKSKKSGIMDELDGSLNPLKLLDIY